MRDLLWVAMAVVFVCGTAAGMGEGQAAEDAASPQFHQCMQKSGGVTVNMNDCYGDELKRLDERLNKAYQGLMAKKDAEEKRNLKAAELAWIKYRDAAVRDFEVTGGTMDSLTANSIFLEITAQRVEMLEKRLKILNDL